MTIEIRCCLTGQGNEHQMSVNVKRRPRVCLTGIVTVVLVTLCGLVAVSSRHFRAIVDADVNSTSRDTMTSPVDVNSSDICTADVFRRHYRTADYFPGEGHWESRRADHGNVSGATLLYRFVPDLCKFRFDGFQTLPGVNVRRCLRRRNITRIVTLGDSNAARYYDALMMALTHSDDRYDYKQALTGLTDADKGDRLPAYGPRFYAFWTRKRFPKRYQRCCSSCYSCC